MHIPSYLSSICCSCAPTTGFVSLSYTRPYIACLLWQATAQGLGSGPKALYICRLICIDNYPLTFHASSIYGHDHSHPNPQFSKYHNERCLTPWSVTNQGDASIPSAALPKAQRPWLTTHCLQQARFVILSPAQHRFSPLPVTPHVLSATFLPFHTHLQLAQRRIPYSYNQLTAQIEISCYLYCPGHPIPLVNMPSRGPTDFIRLPEHTSLFHIFSVASYSSSVGKAIARPSAHHARHMPMYVPSIYS